MAQTVNLRLSRTDNTPWGFRLQGGKDFGQPLLIQKVNGGSLAERAGLIVGDSLIRVNNVEVADLRHKEAQDVIVRAGNNIDVTVQRGGSSTWKPQVSPVGVVPQPGKASPAATVTKTSLAAGRSPGPAIGSGHNISPKPFPTGPQVNGDPSVKAIVNKQYNTPVQMYSEQTIAETLSAQAEVLAGGAIGVNFMKNEKTYDSQKSEVFKMVQEVDKEPREPEQPDLGTPAGSGSGLRHVLPPEPKPAPASPQPQQLPPGQNICADCERLIVGVFVRIKDKNLHVECFKCATCGTSLKNVGYYNINNKLYCDIHAKMVARQNPPAPNVDPITVAPGARIPVGAFTAPQAAAAPQSPQPGTLAPLPFHTNAPSGPKPFGSVSAPSAPSTISFPPSVISPPSAPAPTIPQPPPPSSFSKPLPEHRTPIVWPPTTQSSFVPKSEETIYKFGEKRLSICSEEVSSIDSRKLEINGSILEEERPSSPVPDRPVSLEDVEKSVIEASERIKHRSVSPRPPKSPRSTSPRPMTPRHFRVEDPDLLDISTKPHDIHSLLPPASAVRTMSPKQVVVFPPVVPAVIYSRSPTPKRDKRSPDRCTTCPSPLNALVPYKEKHEIHAKEIQIKEQFSQAQKDIKKSETMKKDTKHIKEHKEKSSHKKKEASETKVIQEHETKTNAMKLEVKKEIAHSTDVEKMFYTKSEVEKLIHEEVLKALALKEEKTIPKEEKVKEKPISVHDLPKPITPCGKMASALTTASDRPFTPVPFPKPMELPSISERIVPMEPVKIKKDEKPVPLPKETEPYFPPPPAPPEKEGMDDRTARALREVGCRSPMTEALTVAPERPYSPLPAFTEVKKSESAFKPIINNKKQMSLSSALTIAPSVPFTVPGKTPIPTASTAEEVQKASAFKPVIPRTTDKFGVDLTKIAEGRHTRETVKFIESGQMMKKSETQSERKLIPYYQENIGEIPVRNRSISPVPHPIVAPSIKPTPPYIPQPSKPKKEVHVSRSEAFQQSSKTESKKAEFVQTKTIPVRPTTPSGLHAPQELPYYQQNIGIIPVRNKSISPVPHQIKAPQLESNYSSSKQQEYKSTVYSETKTYSAQQSYSKSSSTTVTKELTVPERQPSPQIWNLETKRTVQNLSPITVRLPSPRPATPIQGESEQAANAKIQIHRPRPSSPLPPTIKVEVDYPPVTSSGTSIGSGKSAFATVKNGSSQLQKTSDQSVCSKTEAKSTYSDTCKKQTIQKELDHCQKALQSTNQLIQNKEVGKSDTCKKQTVQKESEFCQHVSQSTNQSVQNKQSVKRDSEKSVSSVSKEESVSSQQKVSHSGITSFRAYGESNSKTISSEDYGLEKHSGTLRIERASKAKTFEQKSDSTVKSLLQPKIIETPQHLSKSTTQSYSKSGTDQQQGEKSLIRTTDVNSNLPTLNKTMLGNNKGSLSQTSCPLPTFPSLPQLSDVPWTPGAGGAGGKTGTLAGSTAPKRGRGILNPSVAPGARIPLCGHCNTQIRGPFITALGKIWCPEHFVCVNAKCRRPLQDIGFVEEQDGLYCEFCFEQYLAPTCDKCHSKIKGDCLNAIGKHFHPECFSCAYCGKLFGNNPFFLEDTLPYCENDWNELFTTKCFSCGFPIEAGDRWVEALNNNYHSQCFNCTMCKKNLEGQTFFAKAGRPFCRNHVR